MNKQHEIAKQAITSIIQLATPRGSARGRKERDRLLRAVIGDCKGMMADKRVKKEPSPSRAKK